MKRPNCWPQPQYAENKNKDHDSLQTREYSTCAEGPENGLIPRFVPTSLILRTMIRRCFTWGWIWQILAHSENSMECAASDHARLARRSSRCTADLSTNVPPSDRKHYKLLVVTIRQASISSFVETEFSKKLNQRNTKVLQYDVFHFRYLY